MYVTDAQGVSNDSSVKWVSDVSLQPEVKYAPTLTKSWVKLLQLFSLCR